MVARRGFYVFFSFLLVCCFGFYCFFFVFQRGGLVGSAETKSLTEVRQVLNDSAELPDLTVGRSACFPKGEEGQAGSPDSSNPRPMSHVHPPGQAPFQATLTFALTNHLGTIPTTIVVWVFITFPSPEIEDNSIPRGRFPWKMTGVEWGKTPCTTSKKLGVESRDRGLSPDTANAGPGTTPGA